MGRRNEDNRKSHKKKADDKKNRESDAKNSLKEKRKAILKQFKEKQNESGTSNTSQ